MSAAIPVVLVLLALFVVASIVYLAWEITKEAVIEHDKTKQDKPDDT